MQYVNQIGGLKKLHKEQGRPLDNNEVMELVKEKAKVVLYQDLINYKDIQELLLPHGAVFLLYQMNESYGHWIALIKRGRNEIEFFDPLGEFIDDELEWTDTKMRKKLNMDYPYLTKLLFEAPRNYSIIYNEHKFQKDRKGVATCGRWSALRIMLKDIPLTEFVKLFDVKNGNNDELVTIMTLLSLKE